ncbi:unnamed protein product [Angiostrongylus costaricensis]|uniref:FXNA-like protease n=1 Tax=Angiostrongylus costaricensis TaxID=334426 RepID=A0A158PFQ4_ANGCS|nr:unnamed protein product [Angiostrongylus costaricensis]
MLQNWKWTFNVFLIAASYRLLADNSHFSEVRARRLLFELSNIGPKPAGSEACEGLTRNHILDELNLIKLSATVQFEIEQQNPSGCFDLKRFSTDDITICYRNRESFGTGGSDDLISCALMVELIRLLARQPDMLTKYDVVFLFNGAEESILQGAHGFITQHRWRNDIRAFINLEASGSGGPSNQWLLNSYLAAAVYPHCSIIAQEIFQSGLFPGDTDFRVLRDYGKVPGRFFLSVNIFYLPISGNNIVVFGLDLAFVQNGYWWHTEFDEARRITPGSLQRAGDNVYATLLYLLQSPYLNSSIVHDNQKYVFFDVLGLFVVIYPETVANSINAVLIIAVLLKVSTHFFHYAEYYKDAIADYIVVIVSMSTVVSITSYLTLFIWGAMPWYSIHGLAVLIYGLPALWTGTNTMLFLTSRVDGQNKEDHAAAIENVHQLLIAIILTVFTLKGVGSGYLFALMLFPIVKDVVPLRNEWTTVSTYLLLNLPCFVMFIYLSEMLLSIFIPIMGRTDSNPERVVAVFTTIPVFVIVLSLHVNRALHKKDGSSLVRDTRLYVIAQDYRGVEDIPFVDESSGQMSHSNKPVNDGETQLLLGVASHYLHGSHMQSSLTKHLLSEINERRRSNPSWSITASAWNVDLIYQLF